METVLRGMDGNLLGNQQIDQKVGNENATTELENTVASFGIVNVKSFGAIGDGLSHPLSTFYLTLDSAKSVYPHAQSLTDEIDWCAIQAAMTKAKDQTYGPTRGGTVYIPSGRYIINRALVAENISLYGDKQSATLSFTELGAGAAAITMQRTTGKRFVWSDITLVGPGWAGGDYVIGTKSALCDGLRITGTCMPLLENITIQRFNNGINVANEAGHIKLFHCHIEYNYYGMYWSRNTGDYSVSYSSVNQNAFANFATSATVGIEGLSIRDSHVGYSPFSFYCEPEHNQGGKNQFMLDVNLDHARFEQVGNAAIYADPSFDSHPRITSMKIKNPGFSWDVDKANRFTLPSYPRNYAIDIGRVEDGDIVIESDSYPFTPGQINMMRVRSQVAPAQITLLGKGMDPSKIEVVGGVARVQAGSSVKLTKNGIDERTPRRFSRDDHPNDVWEEDITLDGASGTQYRMSRITDGTRREIFVVSTNNDMRIKRPILLDGLFNPARSSTVLPNPREGSIYIDTSNTGYECIRTYLGASWIRKGRGILPTSGTWNRGDYIENSNIVVNGDLGSKYVVRGWLRLTSSSNNALGTDWLEDKIMTGI
ncbi:MAG TPA: hypothetical protein DEF35_06740 [Paenibacillus sp.]|uniref:glycosyl hydrolase family 28-related protein n=1 Tax=Paenibacillus TaxID=44249 RepID=UPI000BA0D762|nr:MULTISPECIES: glycosyl hydrolase family 28-related protein [Paenibacillus]OZQ73627.1 hypothetical protein CA599_02225 [Paenibacillus taichungensis]HBU81323.1 hypothetical protein [Paenibacillus sp.]